MSKVFDAFVDSASHKVLDIGLSPYENSPKYLFRALFTKKEHQGNRLGVLFWPRQKWLEIT